MKVRELRKQARKAVKLRGHQIGKFSHLMGTGWDAHSLAVCEACGRDVAVYPSPAPNGIDMAGEALAVFCA
jgi:hypothetical protein